MMLAALALASALATKPAPDRPPDLFILTAGNQRYIDGSRTYHALAILEPGALAVRIRPGVELRPYVSVRVAKGQPTSIDTGFALTIVHPRRRP